MEQLAKEVNISSYGWCGSVISANSKTDYLMLYFDMFNTELRMSSMASAACLPGWASRASTGI